MLCIIPARGGSKRLPRKNIMPFCGNPIIYYPIKAALDSELFSCVIVSSDDDEILDYADNCGAIAIKRPPELCTDQSSETDAYLYHLNNMAMKPEYFCAIYPCAAFIAPEEIKGAARHMIESKADAVMGVSSYEQHPYQMIRKSHSDEFYHLEFPTLNEINYPPAYASNGSLYWFRTEAFMKNPTYWQEKLVVYQTMNVDINTESDFREAEVLWKKNHS